MLTVSMNIKTLLQHFGVTNASIAKRIGVDKSTLTRWFTSDSSPRAESVKAIADIFDIPVSMLYEVPVVFEKDMELIKKPDIVYEVSAGYGRINDNYEKSDEYSTVRINGDSMLPSLRDGDLVRVHHITDDISAKDFTVVKINGNESIIKHVEITEDGLWVRSENECYDDVFYTMQECLTIPVTIIGKAESIIERKL